MMDITKLPALSIRQPWCHHILFDGKPVENRNWPTRFRGWVLIHASKTFDGTAAEKRAFIAAHKDTPPEELFGGIVGLMKISDCVTSMDSEWFFGPYGFVIDEVKPLPFIPCKGKLGFFNPVFEVQS